MSQASRINPPTTDRTPDGVAGNERINALSDGIFAIVLTLLVLELRVPQVPPGELVAALFELADKAQGYLLSFVVIGLYWVLQHNIFQYIRRHDRTLLWLNLLFLFSVASMPFPSGLIVEYPNVQAPVVLLALSFILSSLTLDLIWWYATSYRNLVDSRVDHDLVRLVHRRILVALGFHVAAIAFSFFNLFLAELMFLLAVLFYLLPSRLSAHHHQVARQTTAQGGGAHRE